MRLLGRGDETDGVMLVFGGRIIRPGGGRAKQQCGGVGERAKSLNAKARRHKDTKGEKGRACEGWGVGVWEKAYVWCEWGHISRSGRACSTRPARPSSAGLIERSQAQ